MANSTVLPILPLRASASSPSSRFPVKTPLYQRVPDLCTRTFMQLQHESDNGSGAAVVIVPGWFSDCSHYESMASHLRSKGLTTVVVPLKWYNWIPSLGGRSVRPILDRIDVAISLVVNSRQNTVHEEEIDCNSHNESIDHSKVQTTPLHSLWVSIKEFFDPKKGAQSLISTSQEIQCYLQISGGGKGEPGKEISKRSFCKVILVAHSAGGWICRILLGSRVPYDGRIYAASQRVSALVTLGTPHICTDMLTKRNMEFVNGNYPGKAEAEFGVQYLCVAGKSIKGQSQFGGLFKDFAWQSYELCCGKGNVWGDGVIPVECAIGLDGAQYIVLEGVEHFPSVRKEVPRNWYGTPAVIDQWLSALLTI